MRLYYIHMVTSKHYNASVLLFASPPCLYMHMYYTAPLYYNAYHDYNDIHNGVGSFCLVEK